MKITVQSFSARTALRVCYIWVEREAKGMVTAICEGTFGNHARHKVVR